MVADTGVAAEPEYPSHFRPVDSQRWQLGFASSHFTRRILEGVSLYDDLLPWFRDRLRTAPRFQG
jgi:hypothetical protein